MLNASCVQSFYHSTMAGDKPPDYQALYLQEKERGLEEKELNLKEREQHEKAGVLLAKEKENRRRNAASR